MKKKACFVASVLASFALPAGDLSVTEPTTLSASADYQNATIAAPLTIGGGATICIVGAAATVSDRVVVTNESHFSTILKSSPNELVIQGNGGFDAYNTVDTYDDTRMAFFLRSVTLPADATTTAETFDVLTLNGQRCMADVTKFVNANVKPARYIFNGGILRRSYYSAGTPFNADEGKTIILEGTNGNPIVYMPHYYRDPNDFKGEGVFRTQGDCDFILTSVGSIDPVPAPDCKYRDDDTTKGAANISNRAWMRLTPNGTWQWAHAGDFRIQDYAWLRLAADDRLPAGADTGNVRLESTVHYTKFHWESTPTNPRLDLNGYSSVINGLEADSHATVTNYASKVKSTLTFGRFKDGVLNAVIGGNIDVVKDGATTVLEVSDSALPQDFRIDAGTVRVSAGQTGVVRLGRVCLAAGATLVIDGVAARVCTFINNGGTVVRRNGGTLVYENATGKTNYILCPDAQLDVDKVHVSKGALVCSGDCCTNEWWRFRFRAACSTSGNVLEVGHLGFFSVKTGALPAVGGLGGNNDKYTLTQGIVQCDEETLVAGKTDIYTYETETAAKDMPYGSVKLQSGVMFQKFESGRQARNLDTLFSLENKSSAMMYFVNRGIKETDESTWFYLTFRHKQNTESEIWNRVKAYSLYATTWASTGLPRSWTLESSPDGVNWEQMDERSYDSTYDLYFKQTGESYNWFARPDGYALTSGHMNGAKGFQPTASVQVDGGATLDCSMVDDGQVLSSMVCDMASGAGVLKRLSVAEGGVLRIENAERPNAEIVMPYTFVDCSNLHNFANWTIFVNGVKAKLGRDLVVTPEGLVLRPAGMMIILR